MDNPAHVSRALLLALATILAPSLQAAQGSSLVPKAPKQEAKVPTMQEAGQLLQAARWDDAASAFERITIAQPENARAWHLYGYAVHGAGDLERAVELHTKAATFPRYAGISLYNLACAQSLLGNMDASYAAMTMAFETGYSNAAQIKADSDLANFRADARFEDFIGEPKAGKAEVPKVKKKGLVYPIAKRSLDFLIGDWNITSNGQPYSKASYTFDMNAQTIVMRQPNQAMATMTYVEKEDLWRMTWMSTQGHHDILEAKGGHGIPVFSQALLRDQPGKIGRQTFLNIEEGSFDLHWEVSADEGKTWQLQWVGTYDRAGTRTIDPKFTHAGQHAEAPAATGQYGFKLGKWEIKASSMAANGLRTTGEGTSMVYFDEDGRTIHDDIIVSFQGGGGFSGTTVRSYSEEQGQWVCSWNPNGGTANTFVASWNEELGRMVETFPGTDNYGTFTGTLSFFDITEDSLHGRLDRHYEDGTVVEGVWEYIAVRIP